MIYALQIIGEYERGSLASRRNIQPGKTQRPQKPQNCKKKTSEISVQEKCLSCAHLCNGKEGDLHVRMEREVQGGVGKQFLRK